MAEPRTSSTTSASTSSGATERFPIETDGARRLRWHRRFLELADSIAKWSKDPSRGVGAIIVTPSRQIIATGYNGLPRGVEDRPDRLARPVKYDLIVHAEVNAIVQCARNGISPTGCTLYSTFSPCVHCTLAIIQCGIAAVVTRRLTEMGDEHWMESIAKSRSLLEEAKIPLIEVS
ncbi:MAG: dCMP deaminase family protein [Phycisphaeraceae bacterium]|nr:dCMP deaminase family protein [Phycisphaeraceae bacterium]